jgi:hypothetical protein
MGVYRKAKNPHLKPQHGNNPSSKLLTQNFFPAKSIYKCVMDDESFFMVDGNVWQQQSYYESEGHPAIEDDKFIRKTKFPAKVLLWLAASESGISKPVFFKADLAINKEVYTS